MATKKNETDQEKRNVKKKVGKVLNSSGIQVDGLNGDDDSTEYYSSDNESMPSELASCDGLPTVGGSNEFGDTKRGSKFASMEEIGSSTFTTTIENVQPGANVHIGPKITKTKISLSVHNNKHNPDLDDTQAQDRIQRMKI